MEVEDDERRDFGTSQTSEDLLTNVETVEEIYEPTQPETKGATFVRGVALLCACSLSIGSH